MTKLKIAIGNDHAGTELKNCLINHFREVCSFTNFGTNSADSVDYPDFAHQVAQSIEKKESELGILICGSGNGVNMTANKYKNVRSGLAWNKEVSILIKAHNNANVLCIPARFVSKEDAIEIVEHFLQTNFEGGRHEKRVNKIPNN